MDTGGRRTGAGNAPDSGSSSRTAVVIANPAAGGGDRVKGLVEALGVFVEAGWTVRLQRTEGLGHARAIAREAADAGTGVVIAAGGDGTVNEVVNGLVGSHTAMGVIPAGTGNVMAAQLGLIGVPTPIHRANFAEAARALTRAPVHEVDVGYAQRCDGAGRYFLLWVGIGYDAAVAHEVEGPSRDLKRRLGPAAFGAVGLLSAARTTGTFALIRQDRDKTRGPLLWGVVANVPLYAGAVRLSADVVIDDGRLDTFWLFGEGVVSSAIEAIRSRLGAPGDVAPVTGRHERVRILTKRPLALHLDAEPFGTTPVTITIRPRSLRLIVPASAPSGLFKHGPAAG